MVASALMAVVVLGMAQLFSHFGRQLQIQRKQTSTQMLRMMIGFYSFSPQVLQRSKLIADANAWGGTLPSNPSDLNVYPAAQLDPTVNAMLKKCLEVSGNDPGDCVSADGTGKAYNYSLWMSPSGRSSDIAGRGLALTAGVSTDVNFPAVYYNSFGSPCALDNTNSECDVSVRTWFTATCANGSFTCTQAETIEIFYEVGNRVL